nr:MAG TPA: hypothetical protein [Bacteriophage sp.]DAT15710.1 MAG TPA: hypothetical protein [Caudoviricetes sp.]
MREGAHPPIAISRGKPAKSGLPLLYAFIC